MLAETTIIADLCPYSSPTRANRGSWWVLDIQRFPEDLGLDPGGGQLRWLDFIERGVPHGGLDIP